MSLVHLDWFVCRDGYRVDEQVHKAGSIAEGDAKRLYIIPKSQTWVPSTPLETPGLYRELADCDLSRQSIEKFIGQYGFLFQAKARKELFPEVVQQIRGMRQLLKVIERREWQKIADSLGRAGQNNMFPSGGIGRMGVVFRVRKNQESPPEFKIRPASLADALQVMALADVSLGVAHRKCRNPECDHYLAIGGPDGYRSDAEYHTPECRMRHNYLLKRKGSKR